MHTHACTLTHAHSRMYTHTCTLTHAHSRMHTHACTLTHVHSRLYTHACTLTPQPFHLYVFQSVYVLRVSNCGCILPDHHAPTRLIECDIEKWSERKTINLLPPPDYFTLDRMQILDPHHVALEESALPLKEFLRSYLKTNQMQQSTLGVTEEGECMYLCISCF